MKHCPTCNSSAPHLHPAVQFEGEVEVCTDDFHLTPTPQNTPDYIEGVHAKRRRAVADAAGHIPCHGVAP